MNRTAPVTQGFSSAARSASSAGRDFGPASPDIGSASVAQGFSPVSPKIVLVHDWLTGMRGGE